MLRRLRRLLLNTFALLLLVPCLLTVALWIRSYQTSDDLYVIYRGDGSEHLSLWRGTLKIRHTAPEPGKTRGGLERLSHNTYRLDSLAPGALAIKDGVVHHQFGPFHYDAVPEASVLVSRQTSQNAATLANANRLPAPRQVQIIGATGSAVTQPVTVEQTIDAILEARRAVVDLTDAPPGPALSAALDRANRTFVQLRRVRQGGTQAKGWEKEVVEAENALAVELLDAIRRSPDTTIRPPPVPAAQPTGILTTPPIVISALPGLSQAYWQAVFPLWAPVATFGTFFLVVWGIPRLRRRRWRRTGRCGGCGYDLRASKDRCPECGEKVPADFHVRFGTVVPSSPHHGVSSPTP